MARVADVAAASPFNGTHFFWVDFGAGKCQVVFRDPWCPCIAALDEAITLVGNDAAAARSTEAYYRGGGALDDSPVQPVGGMWGGGRRAVQKFREEYVALVNEYLDLGYSDDDQVLYSLLYNRHPELFRPQLLDAGFCPYRAFC